MKGLPHALRKGSTPVWRCSLSLIFQASQRIALLIGVILLSPHKLSAFDFRQDSLPNLAIDRVEKKTHSASVVHSRRLKNLRAEIGVQSQSPSFLSTLMIPPDQGHDPARIGGSFGSRNGDRFGETSFRFAYHDFLAIDAGYLENTHLELLKFSARQYESLHRPRLEEATIVDIKSLASIDQFFQPLAWRFRFSFERLPDKPLNDALAVTLLGGSGIAFEPWRRRLLFFGFAQGHGDSGPNLTDGYRIGASLQGQTLVRFAERLRMNIGLEGRRDFLGETGSRSAFWTRMSYSFTRNLEGRLEWQRHGNINESRAILFAHFLL